MTFSVEKKVIGKEYCVCKADPHITPAWIIIINRQWTIFELKWNRNAIVSNRRMNSGLFTAFWEKSVCVGVLVCVRWIENGIIRYRRQ